MISCNAQLGVAFVTGTNVLTTLKPNISRPSMFVFPPNGEWSLWRYYANSTAALGEDVVATRTVVGRWIKIPYQGGLTKQELEAVSINAANIKAADIEATGLVTAQAFEVREEPTNPGDLRLANVGWTKLLGLLVVEDITDLLIAPLGTESRLAYLVNEHQLWAWCPNVAVPDNSPTPGTVRRPHSYASDAIAGRWIRMPVHFLPPHVTKAERNSIPSPPDGLTVYQTDHTPGIRYRQGGSWVKPVVQADP